MGKTIKIYLPSENVAGIRHAEITNWSGQALACPRSRFQELREWPELQRPGVYLLFGMDDESGVDAIYIGEAEVVIDRLASHITGKGFWSELVAFTSKDENLTKAHVRYLEAQLIRLTKEAGRYHLTNTTYPQLPLLPRSERDAMEEYLVAVKLLLGALGYKALDKLVQKSLSQDPKPGVLDPLQCIVDKIKGQDVHVIEPSPVFHLRVGGIHARAVRTDEGIVVFEGSEASATTHKSMSSNMLTLRQTLIETGAMVAIGPKMKLMRDFLFKSPSQAAGVLVGYSINGRDYWRFEDGTTYAKYEEQTALAALQNLNG